MKINIGLCRVSSMSQKDNSFIPPQKKMLRLLNPKVTLKRPTKSFQYWRGKVWWGVGFYKKGGWKEFHIISEKKRIKRGLDEDGVRELGQDKFVEMLIDKDLFQNVK